MRITTVESTTLSTVAYDDALKLLQLECRSRAVYRYFGVPTTVHEALLEAPSKGHYFNRAIRGEFPYCRVTNFRADVPDAELRPECQR